jgi:hypothetical protein
MAASRVRTAGSVALWLSLLVFGLYFLNVLLGGPLHGKPWMTDVQEMLTLYVAVVFFVIGTLCREAEANRAKAGQGNHPDPSSNRNTH